MKYVDYILGIPKSLIVNLKYLPINQAIKLPILVSHKTKIYGNGKIRIVGNVQTRMIKVGLTGSGTAKYNSTVIENNGTLVLDGRIYFGGGVPDMYCKLRQPNRNRRWHQIYGGMSSDCCT